MISRDCKLQPNLLLSNFATPYTSSNVETTNNGGVEDQKYKMLVDGDDLARVLRTGTPLYHFAESPINFPPSYKYIPDRSKMHEMDFNSCVVLRHEYCDAAAKSESSSSAAPTGTDKKNELISKKLVLNAAKQAPAYMKLKNALNL